MPVESAFCPQHSVLRIIYDVERFLLGRSGIILVLAGELMCNKHEEYVHDSEKRGEHIRIRL